ncbi:MULTISPECIES: cache domain-containing sensor histidine kinase [Bacillus]|uniref:cache domain-containing sensor histidine kinase n=1 Tax=Bacillus TaxID=1386 RepID=UPI0002F4DF2D|nr:MULTISPECIES: sensor histidine kinase [Bacillus]
MNNPSNSNQLENETSIHNFVQGIELLINNVNGVQIFLGNRVYYAGSYDYVGADYDYSYFNEPWYKKTIEADGGMVLFGTHKPFQRKFSNDYVISMSRAIRQVGEDQILGVILLDIRLDMLRNIFSLMEHNQRNFIMVDDKGSFIYSSQFQQNTTALKIEPSALKSILAEENGQLYTKINNKAVYVNFVTSKYSGWKVIQYINSTDVTEKSAFIGRIILLVAASSALLATVLMFFISSRVSKPIIHLSKQVRLIGTGDFTVDLKTSRNDEIGTLYHGFNKMVSDLKSFVERIASAKAKQKEAQLIALHSQINPHFLANTLESIQMKAVLNDQRELGEMIGTLGHLFRLHTKIDQDLVPLKTELEYVRLYFKLQKMRYANNIDYHEIIENGCENLLVVRFMLQPIVENALKYGLERQTEQIEVSVIVFLSDEGLVIEIHDNGVGMDQDTLMKLNQNLFQDHYTITTNHIGTKNVHERIRLHFGEEYGLQIYSSRVDGTIVMIRIPVQKYSDENNG